MEKSKYYTPTIDEFYIGFKYELKLRNRWVIEKYEPGEDCLVGDIMYKLKNEDIRVKYLDQEDIESLGWEAGLINVGNNELDTYGIGSYVITTPVGVYNKTKVIDISYVSPMNNNERLSRVFRGIIKNKSELKKLMKQLGIL